VSLAQPASLELWEIGHAWLGDGAELEAWIGALYQAAPSRADHYDAWLHEAGRTSPVPLGRRNLSAWALLELAPPGTEAQDWQGNSSLLETQGLAVLRHADRYASLECGSVSGGHGHPDRLHLTVHAGGVHWLPDPGAGSYVESSLAWYRSPMAHNAPILDRWSPGGGDTYCAAFDSREDWAWARGRAGEVSRTLIAGPDHLLDIVEVEARASRLLELPWHLFGDTSVVTSGHWEAVPFGYDQVSSMERFIPSGPGLISLQGGAPGGSRIAVHLLGPAELYRAAGPGLPNERTPRVFYLQRLTAPTGRLVAVLDLAPAGQPVSQVRVTDAEVEVLRGDSAVRYRFGAGGVTIGWNGGGVNLGGLRSAPARPAPLFRERPPLAFAVAQHAWGHLPVNGTLEGFDDSEPLELGGEHQYRRSEEPYDESFTAQAYVNWDREALYLGVVVTKSDIVIQPADAAPLNLDNEADDIHCDGIQAYLRLPDDSVQGYVITPGEDDGLRVRVVAGLSGDATGVTGAWCQTDEGYCITARFAEPAFASLREGTRLGFDLVVNEARPDRVRRAGQLVWAGGGGWVYLRGDRQDEADFGVLELA
jgi:hypothetical protein